MDTVAKKLTSPHIVVMGVSGSGKSTVGELLSEMSGLPCMDGDDLHPQANIDKMAAGHPLNDDDRWPWLETIGRWLADRPDGAIVGCSALKRSYRDLIRKACPGVIFVHVHGSFELLESRMKNREGHFMPASLLVSQFETLEPLQKDELGKVFDVAELPDVLSRKAHAWLRTITALSLADEK